MITEANWRSFAPYQYLYGSLPRVKSYNRLPAAMLSREAGPNCGLAETECAELGIEASQVPVEAPGVSEVHVYTHDPLVAAELPEHGETRGQQSESLH